MNKKSILLVILLIVLLCIVLPKGWITELSVEQTVLFLLIGTISIVFLIKEFKYASYSLNVMHWMFVLFFFFLAPIVQIAFGYNNWGIVQSNQEILTSCLFVLLWIIGYIVGNHIGRKYKIKGIIKKKKRSELVEISNIVLIVITGCSILCAIILIKNIGFLNLFARSTSTMSYDGNNAKMIKLLIFNCTRAIIVFSTVLMLVTYIKDKKHLILLSINMVVLLITCFPTGLARNSAATIYIGILVISFYRNIEKFRKSLKYILIFLMGFMILFPAINTFRRSSFSEVNISSIFNDTIDNITNNYLSEDYDAFSIISDVTRFVDGNGMTMGRQLVGALLFFVPRSIWQSKPYGSGQTVFEWFGASFTNISCPLLAEGYINFGILGILLFAVIAGFITSYVDKKYWTEISKNGVRYHLLTLLYPFLLSSYFFMLRGDLMSTGSYLMAYVVVFYIMNRLLYIKFKI